MELDPSHSREKPVGDQRDSHPRRGARYRCRCSASSAAKYFRSPPLNR
jgi:hypothetical protein